MPSICATHVNTLNTATTLTYSNDGITFTAITPQKVCWAMINNNFPGFIYVNGSIIDPVSYMAAGKFRGYDFCATHMPAPGIVLGL